MLKTGGRVFDLAFLKAATRGTPVGEPAGSRVTTDSRGEVTGAVFVALAGPRFDGHDFVEDVLAHGATGALVSASWWGEKGAGRVTNVLVVPDPLFALQDLARAHRRRHPVPLAAVTGSNGKTTTKEILAAALAPLGPVHKTTGNRNNHIGLPLTLLELRSDHRAAVVEIGLNHPGELRLLSEIARPRVGVITNIAAAHLEGLGSVEGVARAKAEIVAGIDPGGALVLPAGNPVLEAALVDYKGRRITFGLDERADLHPERVEIGPRSIAVELADGVRVTLGLPGEHNLHNLLAALAAASVLGVTPAAAAPHLAAVKPVAGRLCPRFAGGVTLLDDSYNANPASLTAALTSLRRHEGGRRWAVLGDMFELGAESAALHRTAGRAAAFVDGLVAVGPLAAELGRGAVDAGLDPARVREAAGGAEAAERLLADLRPGDAVTRSTRSSRR
jgi:UDP-N-acetylmuramoyl-tripeptide--D-alanyl-D-alanine ligase